ncbi:hypothetical protein JYU11_03310 [bacterium AH-315-G05]|nr:hypothetical protein [bacterium AH-315-G05]
MPLDPVTLKILAKAATAAVTDEKARHAILIVCFVPVVLILLVLSSPFAIFFSITGGDAGAEGVSLSNTMNALRLEFKEEIQLEKDADNVDEINIVVVGSKDGSLLDNSTEALIVFAVKYNVVEENSMQVAMLDDDQIKKLEGVFWDMNTITSVIDTHEETVTYTEIDENGEEVIKTKIVTTEIKTITITSFSAKEMAVEYSFNEIQLIVLEEMLKSELRGEM